jgi:6-pyruvoyltetrahydropterin/6-carboxytetrahydropterin synthase
LSFDVGVIERFEAAHSLRGEKFGPASKIHGHTYKVEVRVSGPEISNDGVLTDIVKLKTQLQAIVQRLDYKFLNEVRGLEKTNTTTEELARFIHQSLKEEFKDDRVCSLTVTVWENDEGYSAFSANI